jgi:hypothetical protein
MRRRLTRLGMGVLALLALLPATPLGDWALFGGAHSHDLVFAARAAFAQAVGYRQEFSGQPASPQPWRAAGWDVVVNRLDANRRGGLEEVDPMAAEHGADCGAPPATHEVTTVDQSVFLCRDHVMTAVNGNGSQYAAAYLTPDRQVDFSAGEAVVRFDLSTLRRSDRDWVDLWVTPFEDNLALPIEDWLPAYEGEPRRAVQVRMSHGQSGTFFRAAVVRDHQAQGLPLLSDRGYEQLLTPDAARRDTFELRLSRTRVRFCLPAYGHCWVDSAVADLGWSRGVVQLGHHSYSPWKGNCLSGGCGPNTWHWDNLSLEPAVPFTILAGTGIQ